MKYTLRAEEIEEAVMRFLVQEKNADYNTLSQARFRIYNPCFKCDCHHSNDLKVARIEVDTLT